MSRLRDQVALITGGGSGLGYAIVERFLAEGARVGVSEVAGDKAARLRAEFGTTVTVGVRPQRQGLPSRRQGGLAGPHRVRGSIIFSLSNAADHTGHYVLPASHEDNRTVTGAVHHCDAGVGFRRPEHHH